MICIVESTIESIQNKNTKMQTYITYNLYNNYIQFSDYFNKIFKINNYIFYVTVVAKRIRISLLNPLKA